MFSSCLWKPSKAEERWALFLICGFFMDFYLLWFFVTFIFFCGRWAEQKLIGVMMKVLTVFFFWSLLTLTEVGKDHHYTFIFISKFHDYFAGVFGLLCQSQSLFNSLSSGPSHHWVMMGFFIFFMMAFKNLSLSTSATPKTFNWLGYFYLRHPPKPYFPLCIYNSIGFAVSTVTTVSLKEP